MDTDAADILVSRDFKINMLNSVSSRKIDSICQRLILSQFISDSTHFTENSTSLIGIILTTNPELIYLPGVGEPCFDLQVRYHCPIFGLLNFKKAKIHTFKRHIWLFDKGNYTLLRQQASNINWEQLKNSTINI